MSTELGTFFSFLSVHVSTLSILLVSMHPSLSTSPAMFDWQLFEALHAYMKFLAYHGMELPLLVAFVLSNMQFTFIMLFIVATLWTIQFSDHVSQVFDNTIDLMLEFQVSLQQGHVSETKGHVLLWIL